MLSFWVPLCYSTTVVYRTKHGQQKAEQKVEKARVLCWLGVKKEREKKGRFSGFKCFSPLSVWVGTQSIHFLRFHFSGGMTINRKLSYFFSPPLSSPFKCIFSELGSPSCHGVPLTFGQSSSVYPSGFKFNVVSFKMLIEEPSKL